MYAPILSEFASPVKTMPRKSANAPRIKFVRGIPTYRTDLMTEAHARTFSRCLSGNNAFLSDSVHYALSPTATGEARWYVEYQPKNPERLADMFHAEQLKRIHTAELQSAVMSFEICPWQPGLYHCKNLDDHGEKEHYVSTRDNECDCTDFFMRCKSSGMICHHLVEAKNREADGRLPKPIVETSAEPPARRTKTPGFDYRKERDRDFS